MSAQATVKPIIFGEYIGSKPKPLNFDDFPDIINPAIKKFHFIIAFASEVYNIKGNGNEDRVGTGNFYRKWLVPLIDGRMIRKLKNDNNKVKVILSIGGRGPEYPFNPLADKKTWLDNARESLFTIIHDLKDPQGNILIDGIDINYNTIEPSDEHVFSDYIGALIERLREDNLIKVVSIAPSLLTDGSPHVDPAYGALYWAHHSKINWVNCLFSTRKITTADDFVKIYTDLAKNPFTGGKLLAGFSTDPDDAENLSREVFLQACEDLIKKGKLPGIFIWNANDSASNGFPFQTEMQAQNLLTQN